MPSSFPLPDYPVTVFAERDKRVRISLGAGHALVDGKKLEAGSSVVVDHAVSVSGNGLVTTTETDAGAVDTAPEKPKAEKKVKAEKPKAKPAPKAKPKPRRIASESKTKKAKMKKVKT